MGAYKTKWKVLALSLFCAFTLSACGGGGGGSSSTASTTDTTTDTTATTSSKATLAGTVYTSSDSSGGGYSFKPDGKSKASFEPTTTTSSNLPASGATILIYDLDSTSTAATETTSTDSAGEWSVEIEPGNYIIFSVYLDTSSFTLKVDRIEDIKAEAGVTTTTEDQVVASDEEEPSVIGVLDDTVGDDFSSSLVFDPSPILISQKIPVFFDEPMKMSTVQSAMTLKDASGTAVEVSIESNGALTEFRVVPAANLAPESSYTLEIDSDVAKDMVNNNLSTDVLAKITTLAADAVLEPFQVVFTKPADSATDVPVSAPITFGFNYPVDFVSVKENLVITPSLEGNLQVKGKLASFFSKSLLEPDTVYSVTLGTGAQDLSGQSLSAEKSFSFTTGGLLFKGGTEDEIAVARLVGKFQAAMDSGNYSSLLSLLTSDFVFEEMNHENGMKESLSAKEFIAMLSEEDSMKGGFGDVDRKAIVNTTTTPAQKMMAEHYKNANGYELFVGYSNPEFGVDFVETEVEVTDQWSGEVRREHFMYRVAGGQFDPNVTTPGTCAESTVTLEIPVMDEFGGWTFDETTGEPIKTQQTFTIVDGDCDASNSWATDSDWGNDPWPQDNDGVGGNDPLPFNDNNLSGSDYITSNDEIWNNSQHYFVASSTGDWTIEETGAAYAEVTGPQGYPCPVGYPATSLDYNADGDCDINTTPTGIFFQRVPVDSTGTELAASSLQEMFDQGRFVSFVLEVLPNDLGIPTGERFDTEPDWWAMDDDDGDGMVDEDPIDEIDNDNDGAVDEDPPFSNFDPSRWARLMEDTTDAVMLNYHLESTIKIQMEPVIDFPVEGTAVASIRVEITETWYPNPPFNPEHPEMADSNGDGVVDDKDNTFTFFEHRSFICKNKSGEWLLAKIGDGSPGGGPGPGEFEFFGLPVKPVSPAPEIDASGFMSGPPENVGVNPTFAWSFDEFPVDANGQPLETIGSVALIVFEMGDVATDTFTRPEPVKAHIRIFSGEQTSYVYGSDVGMDVTAMIIQDVGNNPEDDFPVSDPTALVPVSALEEGKAYMWIVMAFGTDLTTSMQSDAPGDDRELGESPPILFGTTTMPSGFGPMDGPPLSKAKMKVNLK